MVDENDKSAELSNALSRYQTQNARLSQKTETRESKTSPSIQAVNNKVDTARNIASTAKHLPTPAGAAVAHAATPLVSIVAPVVAGGLAILSGPIGMGIAAVGALAYYAYSSEKKDDISPNPAATTNEVNSNEKLITQLNSTLGTKLTEDQFNNLSNDEKENIITQINSLSDSIEQTLDHLEAPEQPALLVKSDNTKSLDPTKINAPAPVQPSELLKGLQTQINHCMQSVQQRIQDFTSNVQTKPTLGPIQEAKNPNRSSPPGP